MTVKIVSSWSNPGGGTVAHIALTNLLNANGIDTIFYGPHEWHRDKCKSEPLNNFSSNEEDILIVHFIDLKALSQLKAKRKYLYCHETNLYPLAQMELRSLDSVVFVSNSQKRWHSINYPSVIIPPVVTKVNWSAPNGKQLVVGGVIGSIDHNKQTHLSIQKALEMGCTQVLLYGDVTDLPYFHKEVSPYINSGKAVLMGHRDDREGMYNSVDMVFISSLRETFGLVRAECVKSDIPHYIADSAVSTGEILSDEEILEKWKTLFE